MCVCKGYNIVTDCTMPTLVTLQSDINQLKHAQIQTLCLHSANEMYVNSACCAEGGHSCNTEVCKRLWGQGFTFLGYWETMKTRVSE